MSLPVLFFFRMVCAQHGLVMVLLALVLMAVVVERVVVTPMLWFRLSMIYVAVVLFVLSSLCFSIEMIDVYMRVARLVQQTDKDGVLVISVVVVIAPS